MINKFDKPIWLDKINPVLKRHESGTISSSVNLVLVSLDFQKAIDSLEWSFMVNALDTFNFELALNGG